MIWIREMTLEQLNALSTGCMLEHLGIVFTALTEDTLCAEMSVDRRTKQPFGLLHGGASVVLAETLGSAASYLCCQEDQQAVGIEVNASHLRAVHCGTVRGECRSLYLGGRQQVWQIMIFDQQEQLCCSARLTTMLIKQKQING